MSTSAMLTNDEAWAAVLARNPAADAALVYAVTSTGIFCRPSCPSRRPARANVRFFDNPAEALRAGFRPCRRCRPQLRHPDAQLVETMLAKLRCDRLVTLGKLADETGLSPFTVERVFRRMLGITPAQYQRQRRASAFRQGLADGSQRVTDAVYEAGYSGPGRAYENAQLGMAPGRYRAGGSGISIGYAIGTPQWSTGGRTNAALGQLLIAATGRGLCAVILGDDEEDLLAQLRSRFSAAKLSPESSLSTILDQVLSQFTEHPGALDLPLEVRATAFQMRVWEALRRIPRGETRTYSRVAHEIGQPTAVRAVARACAMNPVAVVVPCHRVIGSDGKLTGYRWGVERKKRLLEIEGAATGPADS